MNVSERYVSKRVRAEFTRIIHKESNRLECAFKCVVHYELTPHQERGFYVEHDSDTSS